MPQRDATARPAPAGELLRIAARLAPAEARLDRPARPVDALRAVEASARAALADLGRLVRQLGEDRLAGELHDRGGHGLSLVCLQAAVSAARVEAGEEPAHEATRRVAALVACTVDDLLAPVGRVGALTGAALPGSVQALADEARRSGQPVEVARCDEALPATAVAVVREALANARKHAGAAPVRIEAAAGAGGLLVEVANAPGAPLAAPGSRTGLRSAGERVRRAGGTLTAGPTGDGGWRVRCALPAA